MNMMKRIGLGLLLGGFVWILIEVGSSFASYQHARWVWQSQNLSAGDSIPREEAVAAMRELSVDLNRRQRFAMLPGCLMLVGGLLIYFSPSQRRQTKPADKASPNS